MSRDAYDVAVDRINKWVKDGKMDRYLNLNDVGLTDGEFHKLVFPANLERLTCSGNKLTKIDLNIPNLKMLWCVIGELREINLELPELRELHCYKNKLIKINLNTPNLIILICCDNDLREINIKTPKLQELNCTYNKLSKIQLSSSQLRYLSCNDNKYLYLPKKYRKLTKEVGYDINYNPKATIIQQKYRKYKAKILCNYLSDICFMYNDINHIICLY